MQIFRFMWSFNSKKTISERGAIHLEIRDLKMSIKQRLAAHVKGKVILIATRS